MDLKGLTGQNLFEIWQKGFASEEDKTDFFENIVSDEQGKKQFFNYLSTCSSGKSVYEWLFDAIFECKLNNEEIKDIIDTAINCDDIRFLAYFRSFGIKKENDVKKYDEYVLSNLKSIDEKHTLSKYFKVQDLMMDTQYIFDKVKSKTFVPMTRKDFLNSINITDIPNIDTLVEYYISNYEKLKDLKKDKIYSLIIDGSDSQQKGFKEIAVGWGPEILQLDKNVTNSYEHVLTSNDAIFGKREYIIGRNSNKNEFVKFGIPYEHYRMSGNIFNIKPTLYRGENYNNPIKLWLNVKVENIPYFVALITTFSNYHREFAKFFKVTASKERNDAITIYTYESYAREFIEFIKEIRQCKPELFESIAKPNPFAMKIDDFISFAEINHEYSLPDAIADIYEKLNKNISQVSVGDAEKIKSEIMKIMAADLSRFNSTLPFVNPKNMATSYTKDGTLLENLTKEERGELSDKLNEEAEKIEKEINAKNAKVAR